MEETLEQTFWWPLSGGGQEAPALFTYRMLVAGSLGTLQIQSSTRGPFWGVDFSSTINHPECVLDQERSRMWNFQVLPFFFNRIFIHKNGNHMNMGCLHLLFFLILTVYVFIHSFIYFYWSIVVLQSCVGFCCGVACMWLVVSDSVTPWTVAHQAPLSMGFSRQEYWRGKSFPSPGDLPDPGIELGSLARQMDSLPSEPPESSRMEVTFFFQCCNRRLLWKNISCMWTKIRREHIDTQWRPLLSGSLNRSDFEIFHLLLKCYYFPLPPKKKKKTKTLKRDRVGNISNSRCGKEINETRGPPGQCFSN